MSETNQDFFAHGDSFRPETLMTVLPVPPIVLTSQKIAFGSIGLSITLLSSVYMQGRNLSRDVRQIARRDIMGRHR
jgi:hypothetical protein